MLMLSLCVTPAVRKGRWRVWTRVILGQLRDGAKTPGVGGEERGNSHSKEWVGRAVGDPRHWKRNRTCQSCLVLSCSGRGIQYGAGKNSSPYRGCHRFRSSKSGNSTLACCPSRDQHMSACVKLASWIPIVPLTIFRVVWKHPTLPSEVSLELQGASVKT